MHRSGALVAIFPLRTFRRFSNRKGRDGIVRYRGNPGQRIGLQGFRLDSTLAIKSAQGFLKANNAVLLFLARMAKSADAADLKSAGAYPPWGFKSPSGHQLECSFQYLIFCRDALQSLQTLKNELGLLAYEKAWGYPFPAEAESKLKGAILIRSEAPRAGGRICEWLSVRRFRFAGEKQAAGGCRVCGELLSELTQCLRSGLRSLNPIKCFSLSVTRTQSFT